MFSWGRSTNGPEALEAAGLRGRVRAGAAQAACPGAAPRPTVKVLVWNRINGYLNWLEPDAGAKCRARQVYICQPPRLGRRRRRRPRGDAHKDPPLFPPQRRPGQKYALVSLEQPGYVPRLTDQNYVSRFDYVMTYDLDTTIPMLTIPQMYNASRYFERGKPWELRKDAVAVFVSNCRNAGASNASRSPRH